jgi:hypothetical protein
MSFFQNPFLDEFRGNWLLGDRQHIPTFVLPGNAGRGKEIVYSWAKDPYDMSGNDADGNPANILKINYCLHNFKNWGTMSVNVSTGASSAAAVTAKEVVAALNANTLFAERFTADYGEYNNSTQRTVRIRSKRPCTEFQFYIGNGQAEEKMKFNARAGVAELPTYFARHTIANRFTYTDSEGKIIQLAPGTATEAAIINTAVDARGNSLGYSSSTVQADYQLLAGRAGIFTFQKGPSGNAVDATKTTTTITYPAGAKAGDLAEKVVTQYDTSSVVVAIFHMPYTLTGSDLVTPP